MTFYLCDHNALRYIKSVLPYIYEALSTESLSYSSWKKLERFTDSAPLGRSWEQCSRQDAR